MDAYDEAADCDAGEDDDNPPLARAASRGQVDTVMALLQSGARISERRASDGKTAAHLAAEEGHAKVRVYACALGTLRRKHQTRSARKRGAQGAANPKCEADNILALVAARPPSVGSGVLVGLLQAAGAHTARCGGVREREARSAPSALA